MQHMCAVLLSKSGSCSFAEGMQEPVSSSEYGFLNVSAAVGAQGRPEKVGRNPRP